LFLLKSFKIWPEHANAPLPLSKEMAPFIQPVNS